MIYMFFTSVCKHSTTTIQCVCSIPCLNLCLHHFINISHFHFWNCRFERNTMISVYSGHQVDLPHLRHNGGRRATEKTGRLFGCLLDYGRLVWCFLLSEVILVFAVCCIRSHSFCYGQIHYYLWWIAVGGYCANPPAMWIDWFVQKKKKDDFE